MQADKTHDSCIYSSFIFGQCLKSCAGLLRRPAALGSRAAYLSSLKVIVRSSQDTSHLARFVTFLLASFYF